MNNLANKNASSKAGATVCRVLALQPMRPANQTTHSNDTGNAASAQRARLLAALNLGAVTTLSARRELDVMHPAARIMELRALGNAIETVWSRELSDCGEWHRVGKYLLASSAATVGGAK